MAYDLIKISALPAATPDESQEIVVGVGDLAKRINYGDVKADMVGTSPSYTTDTEPYLMRQTAHTGVVGKCALNKLVGGSLGWNQLIGGATTSTLNGVTFTNNGNGSWTITGTQNATNTFKNISPVLLTEKVILENHVYYISGCNSRVYMRLTGNGSTGLLTQTSVPTIRKITSIYGATGTWVRFQIADNVTTINETLTPQVLDLTAMFGSTIADYIYSLESATAGAGVAWLSKYIDLGTYHAYDAGSIQSVQATAHVTKDANDNVIGNYPLGSDTLRGIPQLVSNKLSYDGDEKYPDGTIKRKYGYVDLGSLNWAREPSANSGWRFYSIGFNVHKKTGAGVVPNMICPKYIAVTANQTWNNVTGISNNGTSPSLTVCDMAYSDAASFKTAMSGVYLVYELETYTTESSSAYQRIQTIDADGTESFTTSTPVPVGHETQTPDNILAALGWLGE